VTDPFERNVRVGLLDTGYKSKAVVTVRIKWDGTRLSLVGDIKRPGASDIDGGGQIHDHLAEIEDIDLSIPAADRDRLKIEWQRWHLNDMRAGCTHQRDARWNMDQLSQPCPVCGYRFGSAWLTEPVPEEIVEWLRTFPARATAQQLADIMLVEIAADRDAGRFDRRDDRRGEVQSFGDLHDHVDANEYVIQALEAVGWGLHTDDDEQMTAINAATDIINAVLAVSGLAGIKTKGDPE
jgi:hypothetical protein